MQMEKPFTKEERKNLIQQYRIFYDEYQMLMDQGKYEEATISDEKWNQLKETYFEKLPQIVMSCCPYDNKPLVRTFDPFGLDGFWWRKGASPDELPSCPHFCVLRGAVNYNGLPVQAGNMEIRPGPEVPYVLPRLLDMEGMIAVVSSISMDCGYTAYPIAYFADKRPPVDSLTAEWRNTIYTYKTQLGEEGWIYANDVWDFDLLPWLKKRKLFWCEPGSDNTRISEADPRSCPYLDLPGRQENIIVENKKCWTMPLPDGSYVSPYDD